MELIGRRFGHIRVTDAVGQGGMGEVYAAYDETLERKVALKVLNTDQRLDGEARERLLREARALSRLDHPNICRIYDYIESEDVDLLVLEYIDGITLYDADTAKMTRREKLRIAVAVAQVLVAAHRAGIIHRDLKPENVMLTRSGEVKVLDFGLARWLHLARARSSDRLRAVTAGTPPRGDPLPIADTLVLAPTDQSASPPASGRAEVLATAIGITLGTPLYMSPEQARGEPLTPASDLFSFGLLLQWLFTRREPHPDGLSARDVILRVSHGETLPVQHAPGDVTAFIQRLKSLAPTDRPTAVEAAERLKFLDEKPQRIVRRGLIAALIVLAVIGGWRYTIDLKAERAKAVAAHAEADRRRAQAEGLIEFMLGDLRKKLEPVGKLEILDDVGARAIAYVESLDPATMTAEELAQSAKALNQLGEVRVAQGKTAEALAMFRRSLALADQALRREPRNPEVLLVHGATHFWIGNGLRLSGDRDRALYHMRQYVRDGEALAKLDASNREYQLERAYGHSGVALILEAQGKYTEALEHYDVSLKVKSALAAAEPQDPDAQAELARAQNKVGAVLYRLGDLAGARRSAEREVEIYRLLRARDPQQAQWKQRLATSMAYLARSLYDTGQPAAALELWREELVLERELAALDSQNVRWQRNVAITSFRLASALLRTGHARQAESLCRAARTTLGSLVGSGTSSDSLKIDQAAVDVVYARVLVARGEASRARSILREVVQSMEKVRVRERGANVYLASALLDLGPLLSEAEGAEKAGQRAELVLEPLIGATSDPADLDLWMRVLLRRGRTADARMVLARLRSIGYDSSQLDALCRESGC